MPSRLETIQAMLVSNPRDVFLNYSLAMELLSAGKTDDAAAQFAKVIALDPSYLPAYVEAGKAYRAAGKLADARTVFTDGLKLAAAKGDAHVRDHIQQQLEGLRPSVNEQ